MCTDALVQGAPDLVVVQGVLAEPPTTLAVAEVS